MKDTGYNFYALTPIDDADIGVYESALDFVFTHDNVLNIAVSGSYGAGKSSVLASYNLKPSMQRPPTARCSNGFTVMTRMPSIWVTLKQC
jgi:DNA replication protein DnaC